MIHIFYINGDIYISWNETTAERCCYETDIWIRAYTNTPIPDWRSWMRCPHKVGPREIAE